MRDGILLQTSSCSVPTFKFFLASRYLLCTRLCMQCHASIASTEEKMYSMWKKVECILWMVQFKLYTCVLCVLDPSSIHLQLYDAELFLQENNYKEPFS
jgi:hypothetical protein